jgi:hypothetical protein
MKKTETESYVLGLGLEINLFFVSGVLKLGLPDGKLSPCPDPLRVAVAEFVVAATNLFRLTTAE